MIHKLAMSLLKLTAMCLCCIRASAEISTTASYRQSSVGIDARQERATLFNSAPTTTLDTTPDFTIKYSEQSPECRNIATQFAYENNLCDAQDPHNYLISRKAYFSCEGRCGVIPHYSRSGTKECACDAICAVLGDCCRDIRIACPKIYADALVRFPSHGEYFAFCGETNLLMVHYCQKKIGSDKEMYDSEVPNSLHPRRSLWFLENNNLLPLPPRKLKHVVNNFGHFNVVDVSTGLIFKNINDLAHCKESRPMLYFFPVVTFLECSRNRPTKDRMNIAKALGWCQRTTAYKVQSPFHRSCNIGAYINCACGQDLHLTDHLHNACIGFNSSLATLYRRQLFKSEKNGTHEVPTNAACSTTSFGISSIQEQEDLQIGISTLPKNYVLKLLSQDSKDKNPFLKAEDSKIKWELDENDVRGSLENDGEKNVSHKNDKTFKSRVKSSDGNTPLPNVTPHQWFQLEDGRPIKQEDRMHVVEITNTVERRLLCDSLESYVTDCQILDCARGAILSHDPDTGTQFGGFKCRWPTSVIVKTHSSDRPAPLCFCMEVLAFFSKLGIWDVKMHDIEEQSCVIPLVFFYEEHSEPLEAYELGHSARLPDPRTKWTLSLETLTERIRNLYRDKLLTCQGSSLSEDIDVCIRFSNFEAPRGDFSCIFIRNGEVFLFGQPKNGYCQLSFCIDYLALMLVVGIIVPL